MACIFNLVGRYDIHNDIKEDEGDGEERIRFDEGHGEENEDYYYEEYNDLGNEEILHRNIKPHFHSVHDHD